MERVQKRNVRVREGLAKANDWVHKYFIIPFLLVGQLAIGSFWHSMLLLAVVMLQFKFSNCPMTELSAWLRQHETGEHGSGLVKRLYQRLGKWAAIPIAIYLFTLSYLVSLITP